MSNFMFLCYFLENIETEKNDNDFDLNSVLGGFILIFNLDGDVIYASNGITSQLGISQVGIFYFFYKCF